MFWRFRCLWWSVVCCFCFRLNVLLEWCCIMVVCLYCYLCFDLRFLVVCICCCLCEALRLVGLSCFALSYLVLVCCCLVVCCFSWFDCVMILVFALIVLIAYVDFFVHRLVFGYSDVVWGSLYCLMFVLIFLLLMFLLRGSAFGNLVCVNNTDFWF